MTMLALAAFVSRSSSFAREPIIRATNVPQVSLKSSTSDSDRTRAPMGWLGWAARTATGNLQDDVGFHGSSIVNLKEA
jgi:hypothetical protein